MDWDCSEERSQEGRGGATRIRILSSQRTLLSLLSPWYTPLDISNNSQLNTYLLILKKKCLYLKNWELIWTLRKLTGNFNRAEHPCQWQWLNGGMLLYRKATAASESLFFKLFFLQIVNNKEHLMLVKASELEENTRHWYQFNTQWLCWWRPQDLPLLPMHALSSPIS